MPSVIIKGMFLEKEGRQGGKGKDADERAARTLSTRGTARRVTF
jgi:hypothetical protein